MTNWQPIGFSRLTAPFLNLNCAVEKHGQLQPVKPCGYRLPLWTFYLIVGAHIFSRLSAITISGHMLRSLITAKKAPAEARAQVEKDCIANIPSARGAPEYCPPSRTTIDECVDVRI